MLVYISPQIPDSQKTKQNGQLTSFNKNFPKRFWVLSDSLYKKSGKYLSGLSITNEPYFKLRVFPSPNSCK